jgi:ParB family chromosome partitioning protein
LSVREVEFLARPHAALRKQQPYHGTGDPHTQAIQDALEKILGTKVMIQHRKKRGKIVIDYYSLDDLDRILGVMQLKINSF